jgi:hypothetical protein
LHVVGLGLHVMGTRCRVSRAISVRIADELFTIFLELFMAIQVLLVYFVPIVGPVFSFFLMSWLYALYCFEYVRGPPGSACHACALSMCSWYLAHNLPAAAQIQVD